LNKPASPDWLEVALKRLGFIMEGDVGVEDTDKGYCCLKHEIEYGPVELDLIRVSMPLPPGSDREFGKLVYNVIMQEAKSAAKHTVVHVTMDGDGFQIALAPYKEPRVWKRLKKKPAE
jgi:hypothetical protein